MENVFSHKCPTCGAKIPFDPKTQKWVCDYCGGSFTVEDIKSFEEELEKKPKGEKDTNKEEGKGEFEGGIDTHDYEFEGAKNESKDSGSKGAENLDIYTCNNCGAQIVADPNTSATFCVYCGGYTLVKDRLKGEFKPDYIVPFHTTKEEAKEMYLKSIKSKKFAPKNFKDEKNIEKITGVYIPFWTYDCDMRVQKSGSGESIRMWSSGNYDYTEHKIFDFSRDVVASFDDVPVDGSQKFDDDLMDSIEPFDYTKKQPFDSRYLSGFLAEKYDVDKDKAYERAQLRMANTANKVVDNTIGFSNTKITTNYISEQRGEVLYWLLPVWMLNTTYNGITYQFAMNGVSKKVVGRFPTSKGKVAAYFLKIFLIIFIVAYLINSYMSYKRTEGRYAFFDSVAYAAEYNEDLFDFGDLYDYYTDETEPQEETSITTADPVPLGEHGVPEEVSEQKVYDYANLLTDSQEVEIFRRVAKFIDDYNMDMGIVTIDSNPKYSAMVYADDFYDYNNFGTDAQGSGLLLLIDMDTREIYISTKGKAILVYDDERIDKMLDAVYEFVTSDDNRAINEFIDLAEKYAKDGIPESNQDYYIKENGE